MLIYAVLETIVVSKSAYMENLALRSCLSCERHCSIGVWNVLDIRSQHDETCRHRFAVGHVDVRGRWSDHGRGARADPVRWYWR